MLLLEWLNARGYILLHIIEPNAQNQVLTGLHTVN